MEEENKIIIYQTPNGETAIDVKLENDTVWLNRHQLSQLFDRDIKTIGKHINNALKEELKDIPVIAKFATTASDNKTYYVDYYNIEMITSVGYRVKSQRGIQFRIWANKVLKDYLIKGYAINNRLQEKNYKDLKQLIQVIGRTMNNRQTLQGKEEKDLFDVVLDYTYALDTLDKYDYQQLEIKDTTKKEDFRATYDSAMQAIQELKEKFKSSSLFGNEKDDSFKSSINQIYQTFAGKDLYPSVEEKAAMLLYLVTKNHSFSDGNKRIAATLFLWFLANNNILYNKDKTKRIADNTLVALTLMIAESKSEEKDTMVKVVVNLINNRNK
jgi:prophage maintenance system killer protein